jgi:hypothetical protein
MKSSFQLSAVSHLFLRWRLGMILLWEKKKARLGRAPTRNPDSFFRPYHK